MSSKFSKYLVYFTFIILIILLIVLIAKPNKETYASTSPTSSSTISKSMLDEMNTDVGLKDITLTYCGDTCAIGNDEKSLYECEYQDYLETDWSSCSATCGDSGVRTRSKRVLFDFGNTCGVLPPSESQPCNRFPCPIDCVVSDWSDWNTCSSTCGTTGVRSRTRSITTPSLYGGISCPPLTEEQPCNRVICPIDCVVGDWSDWNTCTGDAKKTRTRSVIQESLYGGMSCPPLSETTDCPNLVIFSYTGEFTPSTMNPWNVYNDSTISGKLGISADLLNIKFVNFSGRYAYISISLYNYDKDGSYIGELRSPILSYTTDQYIQKWEILFDTTVTISWSRIVLNVVGLAYEHIVLLNPKIRFIQ